MLAPPTRALDIRALRTHARALADAQIYENGVAGIRITGSNNFTFAPTLDPGSNFREDEENGNVGSLNGPQPIDVIVESSTLVSFAETQFNSLNGELCFFFFFSECDCVSTLLCSSSRRGLKCSLSAHQTMVNA